jgi:PAS domain-containing protein
VTAEVGRVLGDQVELVRSTGQSVSIELRDGGRALRARIVPVETGVVVLLRHAGEGTRERLARTTMSDDSFWQLFEAAPLPLVLEVASTATGEGASRINRKFTEMFGYTADDVPTVQHWWSLAYPDADYRAKIRDNWFARVGRAVADGAAIAPMEATVMCKDGATRAVEFFAAAVGDRHVVIFVDLTERRRAEELSELLPVCAWCKKLRDDQGYWQRLEEFVARRTGAKVTHGICPDCTAQMRA